MLTKLRCAINRLALSGAQKKKHANRVSGRLEHAFNATTGPETVQSASYAKLFPSPSHCTSQQYYTDLWRCGTGDPPSSYTSNKSNKLRTSCFTAGGVFVLPKPYRFSPGRTPCLWTALSLGLRRYCWDWNVCQTSAAQTQHLFSTIIKKPPKLHP